MYNGGHGKVEEAGSGKVDDPESGLESREGRTSRAALRG